MGNIRTIHSHCWRLLEMTDSQLAEKRIKDFNDKYPEYQVNSEKITSQTDDSDLTASAQPTQHHIRENEKLFSEMNLMRQRRVKQEHWNKDVLALWGKWKEFMDENNLLDFTGILENALTGRFTPDIDVLFVDEAQDLSRLQLDLLTRWSKETASTIFIGDSDQAIFRFSGSQPEVFRDLENEWRSDLEQSYRVPPKILEYSLKIISQARDREDVSYKPFLENGEGKVMFPDMPELGYEGSHMIICRCNYQVNRWISYLSDQGLLWHNPYRKEDLSWNPCLTKSWQAVKTYNDLMGGLEIPASSLARMAASVISKDNIIRGRKKQILEMELLEELDDPHATRAKKRMIDLFQLDSLGFTES
ncbi:ATP-dependent helicase, partial [bacterium]|nr:ATP-dependent helicase [bacterium]